MAKSLMINKRGPQSSNRVLKPKKWFKNSREYVLENVKMRDKGKGSVPFNGFARI